MPSKTQDIKDAYADELPPFEMLPDERRRKVAEIRAMLNAPDRRDSLYMFSENDMRAVIDELAISERNMKYYRAIARGEFKP